MECLCPKTGATHYHAQLGLPDKDRAIKGLFVSNGLDLEPLNLLNGLAQDYYQTYQYESYINRKYATLVVINDIPNRLSKYKKVDDMT